MAHLDKARRSYELGKVGKLTVSDLQVMVMSLYKYARVCTRAVQVICERSFAWTCLFRGRAVSGTDRSGRRQVMLDFSRIRTFGDEVR